MYVALVSFRPKFARRQCYYILQEIHLHGVYSDFTLAYVAVRWVGHVARMGERRVASRVLVGKPEGKI
jgi:hypothetical protein